MDVIFIITTLLAVSKIFVCKEDKGVCQISRAEVTCCPDYYNVNGTCTLCPKGSYGDRCQTPCPFGFYGAGCRRECDCNIQQTCNAEEGCVLNVITQIMISTSSQNTTERSTTYVSTDLTNINTDKTTGKDLLVTTQLNLEESTLLWQYVILAALASLMLIAVLCSYCFLVKQCYKKKRMRNDVENGEDVQAPAAGLELIPQSAIVDNTVYGSDYAEIIDSQAAFRDSRVLSSVYDEPSF